MGWITIIAVAFIIAIVVVICRILEYKERTKSFVQSLDNHIRETIKIELDKALKERYQNLLNR